MGNSGLSTARLSRLDAVLAGYVDRGEIPGLVALLCRHDEVHANAIGNRSIGDDPIGRDTIFRISSMTKPITAVAAMILVEECVLRLDEPVDDLLPELADRRVLRSIEAPLTQTTPAHRPITLRDLLTFRMGLGLIVARPGAYPIQQAMDDALAPPGAPEPGRQPGPDEWLRRLGTLPLVHQPGEKWLYNTAADVLGVLIARASGQSLGAFLRERVFAPLGMRDTGFWVPAGKIHRLATAYAVNPAGGLELCDPAAGGQWSTPPAFESGAGGLVSTADDLLAFSRMLLNMGRLGEERILSRPSVAAMTTDQLTPEQKAGSGLIPGYFDTHGWGFGLSVTTRRDGVSSVPGRYGWDGGMGTSWYCDPTEDLVTILLTQRLWTSPQPPAVCVDFSTSAYQAIDD